MFCPLNYQGAGKRIAVKNAPTYFGTVAYEIASDLDRGTITATIEIPSRRPPQTVLVRLRHPQQMPIRSVTVNGQAWKGFNPDKEVIGLFESHGREYYRSDVHYHITFTTDGTHKPWVKYSHQ